MKKPKQRAVDYHSHKVRVGDAGVKGRGVFAREDLKGGEAVEAAPTLVIARCDVQMIRSTFLVDYSFGANDDLDLIGLGFVSLYNHSFEPNAFFVLLRHVIFVRALRPIKAGEEVTFDYGWTDEEFANVGIFREPGSPAQQ